MEERLFSGPREIKFGSEGKAESIRRGFAITTLRNPRLEYNFVQGEIIEANCLCDREKISVVVIANETKPINRQPVPVLALDGYFSAEHAADDLKKIKGYEKTTKKSTLQAIVFIAAEKFNSLPQEQQYNLTHEPIDLLFKDQNLRHLFFPTMCFHLSQLGGEINDWTDFLKANHLISESERQYVVNYKSGNLNVFDLYQRHGSRILNNLSTEPENRLFKLLILVLEGNY